ncbi:pseudoazurin [Devosia epidermidihirudinis]|nr:pseudoazurin [Devosia epidermidihirudinis]
MLNRKLAMIVAPIMLSLTMSAMAADHEIKMMNRGEAGQMVFEPAFLQIEKGDTVKFIATDKGHNAETIAGMIPEGAAPFKGKINEEIEVTFDVEGAYGYKCAPHFAMGMVGLIVVGSAPANLDALNGARVPNRVRQIFDGLVTQIDQ